jgi:serine/threonine protein kinase
LNHRNIITVYDIAETDGVQFIAMEHVQSKTLEQAIGRKRLGLCDALKYATQIASAIATAHEVGIVRRDLKPEPGTGTLLMATLVLFALAKRVPVYRLRRSPRTANGGV